VKGITSKISKHLLKYSVWTLWGGISCFTISPTKNTHLSLPLYRSKRGAIRYMLGTLLLACFKRVLGHPAKSETVGYFASRQQLEF